MEPTVNCTDSISKVTRAIGRRCNTALALRRRLNRLMREFAGDLGVDRLTAAEIELVKHAATLTLAAESRAAASVRGEHVDGDELIRLFGEARHILTPPAQTRWCASGGAASRERTAQLASPGDCEVSDDQ